MSDNPVIRALMSHRSIRKFTARVPTKKTIETIVRAGQQAAFGYQSASVLLSRDRQHNFFHAPLVFTFCVDLHRAERIAKRRRWKVASCDLHLLTFGIMDVTLMAQNMAVAAEGLGLGTCYIGSAMLRAAAIAREYHLPRRVLPVVHLAVGYPAEDPPVRPRYPLEFSLFEGRYPKLTDAQVRRAMETMDRGYLAQDYYRNANFMIPLRRGRNETYDFSTYSWTEHICRKLGQWWTSPDDLLTTLEQRGFSVTGRAMRGRGPNRARTARR